MDALYLIVGVVLGAGIFAAGCYVGWRVGNLSRGVEPPSIVPDTFIPGEPVSLDAAYYPFPVTED